MRTKLRPYLIFLVCLLFWGFLYISNPNKKHDLKRHLEDESELWVAHQMEDRRFFTIHRVMTGNIWKLSSKTRIYLGIGGTFFLVSKEQASLTSL